MQRPTKKVLIREGQDGRLLLGGRWYFRQDDEFVGEAQRWFAQRDLSGWSPVGVPSSWNATDLTENKGTVGWYRKEFSLPEAPKGVRRYWKVRFEGNNYRSTVWLNGRPLGELHGVLPLRAGPDRAAARAQHARGEGVHAARAHAT